MPEFPSLARRPDVDWTVAYQEAVVIAIELVGKRFAEDVVMAGVEAVLDQTHPWDPEATPRLAMHVVEVGMTSRDHKERTERRRRNPEMASKVQHAAEDQRPSTPEIKVAREQEKARKMAMYEQLRVKCEGDADATVLLALNGEGHDTPAALAQHAKMDKTRVRNALKRIRERAAQIAQSMDLEMEA